MRKPIAIVLSVLISLFVLQGCETVKGMSKDLENAWNMMKNVDDADKAVAERYW